MEYSTKYIVLDVGFLNTLVRFHSLFQKLSIHLVSKIS